MKLGSTMSAESREKVRQARLGKPSNNLGKKHSLESRRRRSIAMMGEKNPNWKGGNSVYFRVKRLSNYSKWRTAVFKRDDYICQMCGQRGWQLNADHHPKSYAQILHEYAIATIEEAIGCLDLWDINNGRTLCEPCHRKTPNYAKRYKPA